MAFDLKQSLKLSQQLLMTPQLQQAIKLLQLSRIELEEFVTQQLSENPVLEEGMTESAEERLQTERNRESTESQIIDEHMRSAEKIVDQTGGESTSDSEWENYSRSNDYSSYTSSTVKRGDDEFPNYENLVTKSGTLNDHLMTQIGELDLQEREKEIAQLIIGNIDEKGYLRSPVEELASDKYELEEIEDILDVVQRLDPSGVGARDLRECLLIQIRNNRLKNGVVEKIVESHMPHLENRNFQAIAKAMKIPFETVVENVHTISDLEPIPGRQFGNNSTQYIVPDVYVFKIAEEWVVTLNDEGLPKLRVSNVYQDMLKEMDKEKKENSDKDYIQDKLKSAMWLIKSIQQRQRTIFKVTETIVQKQKEFFESGVEHLKPMILRDIADEIGMHESTISRVTNNKYVHTPLGIFELKYFFNSSVARIGGESMASVSVKKMISDLITAEDAKRPLADQKIVEILEEKGIQVARRTVAKYREQLGILPSSKRKKFY
ncbi:MAG: RNA polymerase factor sigma-54 [Oligoflexales bacterium]